LAKGKRKKKETYAVKQNTSGSGHYVGGGIIILKIMRFL